MSILANKSRVLSPKPVNRLPQLHTKGAELFRQHTKGDHRITKYIIGSRCKRFAKWVLKRDESIGIMNSPVQNEFMHSPKGRVEQEAIYSYIHERLKKRLACNVKKAIFSAKTGVCFSPKILHRNIVNLKQKVKNKRFESFSDFAEDSTFDNSSKNIKEFRIRSGCKKVSHFTLLILDQNWLMIFLDVNLSIPPFLIFDLNINSHVIELT